jgi:serine protease Do
MKTQPEAPAASPHAGRPLIQGLRAKLRLAGAAVLVLGAGKAIAPETPAPAAPEKVAPMLEAAVERREPARLFRPLQDAGRAALPYTVAFPRRDGPQFETHADFGPAAVPPRTPAAFGIVLTDGEVLTHVAALEERMEPSVVLADGSQVSSRVRAYDGESGLVLLKLNHPANAVAATLASERPSPGALAVAAARFEGMELVMPVFVGAVAEHGYLLMSAGGPLPPGMPIYNLAGEAIGIASGGTSMAYSVAETAGRLRAAARDGQGLPRTMGACLQPLSPALESLVGANGVLVSDLQEGGPAQRAGLRAGDVLVRIAGSTTETLVTAREQIASASPDQELAVTVRRQGQEREMQVRVEETLAPHPCNGRRPVSPSAPRAGAVVDAIELSAAGLSDEALILSVNGMPVAQRAALAALRRPGTPRLLHVQDGTRRYFAVVGGGR